jgi:hypothetical protein
MKAQTNEDNIIKDIFLTSGGGIGLRYDPMKLRERAEQIIILYKHADVDPNQTKQQLIDDVIFELCGKSLGELLKYYEEAVDL